MIEESQTAVHNLTADSSEQAEASPPVEGPEVESPSVDELQGRLADLQSAMDQLQAGDLDGAEATIASLEKALDDARQEPGLT